MAAGHGIRIGDFQTSSSKQQANPSNNTLSSVYVNPYNMQDSITLQHSLGDDESEAFGSVKQSLHNRRFGAFNSK